MTYDQTLHYLYNKLPLYSIIGIRAYKADLDNTLALCKHLGDPQNKIKTIHIAGTNGKGSTSHMLAAAIQECGYKTGLYTSPHLKDFRERIKINGQMIARDFIISFVEKTKTFSEEIQPSFFELTFVMALEYFVHQNVEVAVIETGLGGRLDSTNVITPVLSVITNIGFDHMDILGNSLEKIAFEKAGIIKPRVPVIIGEVLPETKLIFQQKADETCSPIYFAEEKFEIISLNSTDKALEIELLDRSKNQKINYTLDLPALYQAKNLLPVLTAIGLLKNDFTLKDNNIQKAMRNVKNLTDFHGRWEVIHRKPLVVLDVAHNADGIQQLMNQVNSSSYKKLHIIFGIVKDKEIDKVLERLPPKARYYFTRAQIPRALPEDELRARAAGFQLRGNSYNDVNSALKAAMDVASEEDLIIICGSIFVVGEVNLIKVES